MSSSAGKGFVAFCDEFGIVSQIVRNEYELVQDLAVGVSVTALFDEACHEKVLLFLDEIRTNGLAFDWELIGALKGGPITLHCAAVRVERQFFVIGANSRNSVMQIIEEMLELNIELTNHLQTLMKEMQSASQLQKDHNQSIYDQLTHVNNQLSAMQRELVKKNHELAKLNQQKNFFLGMVVHDLRSPLGTIASYSEFLLDQEQHHSPEDDRELVAIIKKSSEFMFSLINDLLDISKIESGNLNLDIKPILLEELISGSLENSRVLAAKKGINFKVVHGGNLPHTLFCDRPKIEQVLNNLLSNAVKFSHADSDVTLHLSTQENILVLCVDDNGTGLPEDILEQLFIPFSKATRLGTREEKGTGLGLSIVRSILEGHGGEIRAENISGGGARFVVTLPIGGKGCLCTE